MGWLFDLSDSDIPFICIPCDGAIRYDGSDMAPGVAPAALESLVQYLLSLPPVIPIPD